MNIQIFIKAMQGPGDSKKNRASASPVKRGVTKTLATAFLISVLSGCATHGKKYRVPRSQKPEIVNMETTGYCKCEKCCGWKRNWKFQPVVAYGPNKGKPKQVGITAAGTVADWGTVAADPEYYPFGTIMYVPDYGWGRVEDIGGAIKGQHIDLYHSSHKKALKWGREMKKVKVWKPQKRRKR